MSSASNDPSVLYISGWCRSGSTLIGNLLNEIDGYFHAGELHYLWRNSIGAGTNTICGCGAALTECSVWSPVMREMSDAGKPWGDHARDVLGWQEQARTRHTWRILASPGKRAELVRYARTLAEAYRAAAKTVGARVIVDGSKFPSEAALLMACTDLDVKVLHLVRDPRAVATSWSKDKSYIKRMSPARSTAYWMGFNLATEAVRRRHADAGMLLRYEDFIGDPEGALDAILTHMGDGAAANPVEGRRGVLNGNHTVSGNPDRTRTGPVEIASNDAAKLRAMPWRNRLVATGVALPRLGQYRYAL